MPLRHLVVHQPYPLCPLKLSLDYLEQGSACNFNLSIGLQVGRRRIVVLNPQLLAEVSECTVIELFPIVRDKYSRDFELANNASPNEVSNILLYDGG